MRILIEKCFMGELEPGDKYSVDEIPQKTVGGFVCAIRDEEPLEQYQERTPVYRFTVELE